MPNDPADLDKVFKALGHLTRRRILRLLSQGPRYPYELSKLLDLNRRVVLKHLDALQEAGLIEQERGKSDLGPDRTYYKLNVSFGLSTTILPDVFVVRMTQAGGARMIAVPPGFMVPKARPDVNAVWKLLRELDRVNRKLNNIDEERLRFSSLRGRIISEIEEIMGEWEWDNEICQKVRSLINPVSTQPTRGTASFDEIWTQALKEAHELLENLLKSVHRTGHDTDDEEEQDVSSKSV
ncbi:MAG: helix-turn-helix domain-containing protein [Candidatus Thorarchaeota archaeon]